MQCSRGLLGAKDRTAGRPGQHVYAAMPAIDLPRFKMSDASVGVRTWGPTTAYAGGVALAATWDREFARSLGKVLDAMPARVG